MTAKEFFKYWMEKEKHEYNNIPIEELMEAYHKAKLAELNNIKEEIICEVCQEVMCDWDCKNRFKRINNH